MGRMILQYRSRHVEVFYSTQPGYFDFGRDEYVTVVPGFRMALHVTLRGKLHTWVWERWTVKKLIYG